MVRSSSPERDKYMELRENNTSKSEAQSKVKANPRSMNRWEADFVHKSQKPIETTQRTSPPTTDEGKWWQKMIENLISFFQSLWQSIMKNPMMTAFFLLGLTTMALLMIWVHNSIIEKQNLILERLNQRLDNERKTIEMLEERLKDAESLRKDHEALKQNHDAQAKVIADLERKVKELEGNNIAGNLFL